MFVLRTARVSTSFLGTNHTFTRSDAYIEFRAAAVGTGE